MKDCTSLLSKIKLHEIIHSQYREWGSINRMENNLSFLRSRGREKCCQCHKRKTELESIKHVRGNKRIGWDRNRGAQILAWKVLRLG
jgi:hypothetical protein